MINKQLVNSFIQQNTHESWFDLLSNIDSLHESIWNIVSLSKKTSIEPKLNDMLNAFKYCPLDNLKVIMLGQDREEVLYKLGEFSEKPIKLVNTELSFNLKD